MSSQASSSSSSSARGDLRAFLRNARQSALTHLKDGPSSSSNPLVLIMGNGAGDADSLTSAISLSYLLSTYPHLSLPLSSPLPEKAIYAPLIQTNRSDAHLRPENVAILAATGIDQQDILYLSDLVDAPPKGLDLSLAKSPNFSPEHNTFLGLVDHPQLELPWTSGSSSQASRRVLLLVDHHADASQHQDASLRVFRQPEGSSDPNPTGSAQSIIIELFAKEIKADPAALPQGLADLAIATVLIDTDNMRPPPKGRASETDFAAVEALLPFSSLQSREKAKELQGKLLQSSPQEVKELLASDEFETSAFNEGKQELSDKTAAMASVLSASKAAIRHLSSLDLLKRDYKSSSLSADDLRGASKGLKAGFSSVNLGLPTWLHRAEGMGTSSEQESAQAWAGFWSSLREWMEDQALDVAVVGTSFRDEESDKHKRELVFAMRSSSETSAQEVGSLFDAVRSDLEDPTHNQLELQTPWKGARLSSTGKKERVSGIDGTSGKLEATNGSNDIVRAQVWKQGNARANRKVYLPTIMAALKKAASKGSS
ncbi:hypothetical protein BDZ90DRAFT_257462 [Jaminaea rosea]|uniref:Uncharacterized protein n=1 Tax=Jaminaea rosea TaxID=1569628 RepID=A0A316V1F8_9BASI|nr:hypothetical protein BDZ90DRAFT_257462 [Jaminaea rosea]PWN30381.1 hypothetical protein BDZ90DRAFT_257462 [Jaminaea rosea]